MIYFGGIMKKLLTLALIVYLCSSVFAGGGSEEASSMATWEEKGTPLADVRVRQALRYAIDMDAIVDSLFEGMAETAVSLTSPGSWLSDDLESYSYDPEVAKKLLKEAGWPSDYTLDVVYYYGDQQTVDLMAIIQQYWAAVGVKSSFRKLEGDVSAQLWVPPADRVNGPSDIKWDLAYAAIAALAEHEFYDRFESTASNNSSLPYQKGLDSLIQASSATADVEEQKKAFYDIQEVISENMYNIPLYHQLAFIFVSDKLDIAGNKLGNDQFSYEKDILDWTTTRPDGMIYTNSGPQEFYQFHAVNPGYFAYQELVFDRLINADENLVPTDGMLAKSYKLSADGMKLDFVLRDDVLWHDGEKFDAADVKFTIEYMSKIPGLNAIAFNTFESIKNIAINGNKVSITFNKVDPNALLTFSQWPILPEHLLGGSNPLTAQQDQFWQHPIGTGPYMVEETVLGNYAILSRYNDYFKTGSGNVKKIYMYANGENDPNLLKNAEAGLLDYAYSKVVTDALGLENVPSMTVYPVNIRYTRLFYINQYPHEPNIK